MRPNPLAALLALLALGALPPARAALGDTLASVQADGVRLKASLRAEGGGAYSVQRLQTPEGIAISEYLSPAGRVFAVAWQGPFKPDMAQLLGSYFPDLVSAQRTAGSGRNHMAIDSGRLVVRAIGRQRAFAGRAWDPALVPPGVDVAVLP